MELTLLHPIGLKNKVYLRPGFPPKVTEVSVPVSLSIHPEYKPKLVYEAAKLGHSGITAYKVFENCGRSISKNSISNLLSSTVHGHDTLSWLIGQYKACTSDFDRGLINNQAQSMLDQESFDKYLTFTRQARHVNTAQSRKIRKMSEKLAYYSATRSFTSKKSGKFNFKVAFLTLTAPEGAEPAKILKAFETFLDYLQRTANCHYVWKKELGEKSHNLHFHILINNFVPYYIIAWKWKRALIAQGVSWTLNSDGKESTSHYRIELPKNRKLVAHYIAKYMSKCYDMPANLGYLAGWSRVLTSLKEATIFTGDTAFNELSEVVKDFKRITKEFVSFICVDILSVRNKFPLIGAIFEKQYLEWVSILTLPQKFNAV